tara:strand:- start:1640 stop:1888 length:249 start_codon:yes stop_codon:yes gene_type:complete
MGLGADSQPIELKERCMWVPASIGRKDIAPGVMSFVYGGVSISPKINVTHTTKGSLYSDQNNSRVTINTTRAVIGEVAVVLL